MMFFLILLFTFLIVLIFFLVYRWISLQPYNQKPLAIETFDGFSSPYHPSVLYFRNGWNGWKYWMAETPFSPLSKPYRDRNECPSIHVSNDGVNWFTPEGLVNPLVNLSETEIRDMDYFSDPQLLFVNGRLEMYFRITHRHGNPTDYSDMSICRIKSDNGVIWSDIETVLHPVVDMVSPGMTYDKTNGYRMWYVDSESHIHQRNIAFITSHDGLTWSKSETCSLIGHDINPWHIDVQQIDNVLYLSIYDYDKVSLWRGKSDNPIDFKYVKTVLSPAYKQYGSFYSNGLYRTCLVDTGDKIEMFYSGDDSRRTYIGRLSAPKNISGSLLDLDFQHDGPSGKNSSFKKFLAEISFGYYRWASFVIRHQIKRFMK